jgi:hypothetical protein
VMLRQYFLYGKFHRAVNTLALDLRLDAVHVRPFFP